AAFALQVAAALELLLCALVLEALAPAFDGLVDVAHTQCDVTLLLADARDRGRVVRAAHAARARVTVDRFGVREERGCGIARDLDETERLAVHGRELVARQRGRGTQNRGAPVPLG